MTDAKEVTVTVTPQDVEFRARAKAAGLPDVLISMYGTALRRLVDDEREACAKVCDDYDMSDDVSMSDTAEGLAAAIRARGEKK